MMRFERKYRIDMLDHREVTAVIRDHPASFRTEFPDRQVNNVYLDTPELDYFRENLAGVAQRRKFRIRWYGKDLTRLHNPVLEVKIKDTELGEKAVAPLPDLEMGEPLKLRQALRTHWRNLRKLAPDTVSAGAAAPADDPTVRRLPFPLRALRPALINTYARSYFRSLDGNFRLTIDREMRFYNVDSMFRPYRNFAEDHAVVVEVKYEARYDEEYDLIGQLLPFRFGKNSKYVNGILLTGNA